MFLSLPSDFYLVFVVTSLLAYSASCYDYTPSLHFPPTSLILRILEFPVTHSCQGTMSVYTDSFRSFRF